MFDLTPATETDLATAYAHPQGPWLRANMVISLDGSATVEGRVGGLTSPEDQVLLHLLRSLADVTLVGAGTIRAEGYGPLGVSAEVAAARASRGQTPEPGLAIVTHSCDLDPTTSLFTEATTRPIVITHEGADPGRRAALARVADVVLAGERRVDLAEAVRALHARGLTRVLTEGGPSLLADLFDADLVDELLFVLSPQLVGAGVPLTTGAQTPRRLSLTAVHRGDDFLFLQYRRA
ncbi:MULTISPECIES: pyrimidine reductase family protein [Aestuariimicrobium]|uniref:pyrimidine reductase family protein n=1 Tax=Aestuariimicrobium TaxID=396388 RepID=UPI0003B6B9C0|nr:MULTISPECIES: pyrimidine reductase family protein [Aestuariimicrobium]CAI9407993.1 2,5-diamino-6-ribosylamino-4(3H)-pyrimidinone 5'-phosphate reductase [Aestuariimicrobium sp. T2.26MG-19.2B]